MKKNISIMTANPAGNITVFVMDRFGREDYQKVAKQLLAMEELHAEQVAFIQEPDPDSGADGRIEMCGLEFCGNASRSYGLILAREKGIKGQAEVSIDMSGCSEILTVRVDTLKGHTKVKMPLPANMAELDLSKLPIDDVIGNPMAQMFLRRAGLVDFGGIVHVVISNIKPEPVTFELIKEKVMEIYNPPAVGVMFCDSAENKMVPVVYVKDVDTTYYEGSCGSGTTACALAFAKVMGDGVHKFSFPQPEGIIDAEVTMNRNKPESVYIEGIVEISEPVQVEIDL